MPRMKSQNHDMFASAAGECPPTPSFVDRLIRLREVQALAGIGRNTVYSWMADGKFPLPVDLGGCRVAWRLSDINAWIASRRHVTSVRVKRGVKPWERSPLEQKAS